MLSYWQETRSIELMYANIWTVSLLILIIIAYVVFKVRHYMRLSDEQWRRVDKSKLVQWDDDDDWPAQSTRDSK